MKAKLKGRGIKGLLLLHGEKLGMAIVGACAVLFIYASLSQDRLPSDYGPDNLDRQIRQARQTLDRFTFDEAPDKGVAQPLRDLADIEVQADAYKLAGDFDRPVVPPTVLRTDPTLLAAEDVTGHGGSGLLAFIDDAVREQRQLERERERQAQAQERAAEAQQPQDDRRDRRGGRDRDMRGGPTDDPDLRPAGGSFRPEGVQLTGDERVELAFWACVVAEVPIKKQLGAYRDVFDNARGGDSVEFPNYAGFIVRRAEVRPGQPLQWEPAAAYDGQGNRISGAMSAKTALEVTKDWAPTMPEVVDPRYPDDALVFPLPPLVGRDWGEDVTHAGIPLASAASNQPLETDDMAAAQDADDPAAADPFGAVDPATGRRGFGRPGQMPRAGMMRMEQYERPPRAMAGGGMARMPAEGGMRPGRGMGRERSSLPPGVTHLLLRFFDFNVQPGKKYKYQVQLVLADPNQGVPKRWLDPAVLDRIDEATEKNHGKPVLYRRTDWSEPSDTIGIPDAGTVRLASAKAASTRAFNDEASVKLVVESFDVDDTGRGMQAQIEDNFRRGSVVNLTDDAEILVQRNQYLKKAPAFKFHTGITVLDIRGGDRISRDVTQPASVLLMSTAGQLSIRDELADADDVQRYQDTYSKDAKRRGRRGGVDDRFPGGMPEGGRMPGAFENRFGR